MSVIPLSVQNHTAGTAAPYVSSDLHVNFCHTVSIRDLRRTTYYPAGSHLFFLLCTSACSVQSDQYSTALTKDSILYASWQEAGHLQFRCPDDQPGASLIILNFAGTMADDYLSRAGFHAQPVMHAAGHLEEIQTLIRKLTDIHFISEANELLRTALVYQLFAILISCRREQPSAGSSDPAPDHSQGGDYLYSLLDYIRKHVDTVTIEELSRIGGVSRTYIYRLFRKQYGVSPSDFLLRYRLNLAAQKIQAGEDSLENIAFSVGYKTYAGFSTAFQKYFHILPTAARERHSV